MWDAGFNFQVVKQTWIGSSTFKGLRSQDSSSRGLTCYALKFNALGR